MIPEKYIELINGEIDRTNSPRQTRILRRYIEENAEAMKYYNDLCALEKTLSRAKEFVPPENLRQRIINSVPFRSPRPERVPGGMRDFVESVVQSMKFSFSYGFAAGAIAVVIVGAVVLGLLSHQGPVDVNHLYGTITRDLSPALYHQTDQISVDRPEIEGNVILAESDTNYVLDFRLDAKRTIEVKVVFGSGGDHIIAFGTGGSPVQSVRYQANTLAFTVSGQCDPKFALRQGDHLQGPVVVSFYSSGAEIFQGTLRPENRR